MKNCAYLYGMYRGHITLMHDPNAETKMQMQLPCFEVCAKNSNNWVIVG